MVARTASLRDFVIPLLLDDLPHSEINIQLARLNAISFNTGWAQGLRTLLEKLERDSVPKDPRFSPTSVASWWSDNFPADGGVICSPEEYFSNWFRIKELPETIHFHALPRPTGEGPDFTKEWLPYPALFHKGYLLSFAKADNFSGLIKSMILKDHSESFSTSDFLSGTLKRQLVAKNETGKLISQLLRLAWERMVEKRGLPVHKLSHETMCLYFTTSVIESGTISFTGINGKTFRGVIGYRTLKPNEDGTERKRFWHFAVQARPMTYPDYAYAIKPHVLFSDDGIKIWTDEMRLQRARRRQCKDWWNPEWRAYVAKKEQPPKELFIHGKVRFNEEEWKGFQEAVDSRTNLVGIRIRDERDFKLYRRGDHPVLRGLAYIRDQRTAYLWTKGFTPRLQTYPGREVPKPLMIDICVGSVAIETVLQDILSLTKLNYNACVFADGEPVTLKFADAIGEILTAGPIGKLPPLPFKYYI